MHSVSLGFLEQHVMQIVWRRTVCTVRDVVIDLQKHRAISYNTVQTVMTRLVGKGLLHRTLVGKNHTYRAVLDRRKTLFLTIHHAMSGFLRQWGEDALIAFVDGIGDISDTTRRKLIRALQRK